MRSRIALGQTEAGRYLRVIYMLDPTPGSVFVITAYELGEKPRKALAAAAAAPEVFTTEEAMKKRIRFPPGWNDARVQRYSITTKRSPTSRMSRKTRQRIDQRRPP